MLRRILGSVLVLFGLVGCSDDSPTDAEDLEADTLIVEDDDFDEVLAVDAASDDGSAAQPARTLAPRAPTRPDFEVIDGVTRFNSAIRLPSLWGIRENDDPTFDGGGISFYRFAPDATTIAMAIGNSCAQVLLDIEQEENFGPTEVWTVTRLVSVESTCDTPLTEMIEVGDELLIDVWNQQAMAVGTSDVVLFATMFESFSDQGDPRRDPAGAVDGRTSAFFG